jgi:hypothetical protein
MAVSSFERLHLGAKGKELMFYPFVNTTTFNESQRFPKPINSMDIQSENSKTKLKISTNFGTQKLWCVRCAVAISSVNASLNFNASRSELREVHFSRFSMVLKREINKERYLR